LVEKHSSKKIDPYVFGLQVMDSEFDRILLDMKMYLEGYLKSIQE